MAVCKAREVPRNQACRFVRRSDEGRAKRRRWPSFGPRIGSRAESLHGPVAGRRQAVAGPFLWVAPALAYLFFFWGYPALYAVILSFTDASLGREAARFTGGSNYIRMFQDPLFWISLKNTGMLLAGSVVLEVSLGLWVALHLHKASRFAKGLLTTVLLLPWLFSELVTALTWRWIFHEPFGLLNALLGQFGLGGVAWLGRPGTAMGALMLASLWQGLGMSTLVILAALKGIPPRLTDLAALEGAVGWKGVRHVILPQIKGVLLLDSLLVAIKSLGAFTLVYALTGGGPGTGTEVLATYMYRLIFFFYEPGYGSALGIALTLLFMFLVFLVRLLQKEGEDLRAREAS